MKNLVHDQSQPDMQNPPDTDRYLYPGVLFVF